MAVLVLLSWILATPGASPSTARGQGAAFEALANAMGRADAWHAMYPEFAAAGAYPGATPRSPSPLMLSVPTSTITPTSAIYLPLIAGSVSETPTTTLERRAIWITRYDWTQLDVAPLPVAIDEMVNRVAGAGFNTIYFQVRGAGEAYYTPGLEPWAARLTSGPVSETLGVDPGWDPLARMVELGHNAGLEVHAYVNVYTAWLVPPDPSRGDLWPPATTPPQMFDRFTYGPLYEAHPGEYALGYDWRQHDVDGVPMPLRSKSCLWASPGLDLVNDYLVDVVSDIVTRYDVDGVHLDLVRYAGAEYSYDPFSNAAAGDVPTPERAQWQRDRVTDLVRRLKTATQAIRPEAEVSAAVWPYYIDLWGKGFKEGYHDYYQDSKGWLASDAVDAIAPMLYGGYSDDAGWWQVLMLDFVESHGGDRGKVYPGIGAHYNDFTELLWRIEAARGAGAPGHAIFSYAALNVHDYWDDLASGPYRLPADPP
ncbi:MAG: glycoside hydrolase family 10 protein [Anaerolineae bacterium]